MSYIEELKEISELMLESDDFAVLGSPRVRELVNRIGRVAEENSLEYIDVWKDLWDFTFCGDKQ